MNNKIYEPVSSVYMYIFTDDLSTAQAEKIIGKSSGHIPHIKLESPLKPIKYIWWLQTKWHSGDDVNVSLEHFLFEQLPDISEGLTKIKEHNARIQIDWVIGIGDVGEEGYYPILSLGKKILSELNKWSFDFKIYFDSQIGAE